MGSLDGRHPGIVEGVRWFEYGHLPDDLAAVSERFADLAHWLVSHMQHDTPQLTLALHNLLTAKDAAVRAALIQRDHEARAARVTGGSVGCWPPVESDGDETTAGRIKS